MVIAVLVIYAQSWGQEEVILRPSGAQLTHLAPTGKENLVPRDKWTEEPNVLDEVRDGENLCLTLGLQHRHVDAWSFLSRKFTKMMVYLSPPRWGHVAAYLYWGRKRHWWNRCY